MVKCNIKLVDRLVEYCIFYRDITTIGLVMTAIGASIHGYFGRGMTIEDIMTAEGKDSKMPILAQPRISNHDAIKFNGRQINKNYHSHNYSRKSENAIVSLRLSLLHKWIASLRATNSPTLNSLMLSLIEAS